MSEQSQVPSRKVGSKGRRCNLDGQPISKEDQEQIDAFALFLKSIAKKETSGERNTD